MGTGGEAPRETTLAPQLGVGRSTVREAIRQLAGRGVLASRQGAGVFVIALDAPEDWDAVLRKAGIVAVIEARIAIETEAAALAAARRTPSDLRSIRRALADRDAHRSDIDSHVDADTAFHRAVVAASHNAVLLDLFDSFTPGCVKPWSRCSASDGSSATMPTTTPTPPRSTRSSTATRALLPRGAVHTSSHCGTRWHDRGEASCEPPVRRAGAEGVDVIRGSRQILTGVDLTVRAGSTGHSSAPTVRVRARS